MQDAPLPSDPIKPNPNQSIIPVARPVAYEYLYALLKQNPLLAFPSSRLAALRDIMLAMVLLVVAEMVTGQGIVYYMEHVKGLSLSGDELSADTLRALILPTLVARTLSVTIILFLFLWVRNQSASTLGVSSKKLGLNLLLGLPTLAVAYALICTAMVALWFYWPEVWQSMNDNANNIMEMIPRYPPLIFLGISIMVGWYEELFFRGFLMTRLRRATGSWVLAVILSTLVFTSLHAFDQTKVALIMITLLSLVFSVTTIWRRSIIPAIVAHALFDFSQFMLLYLQAGDSWA